MQSNNHTNNIQTGTTKNWERARDGVVRGRERIKKKKNKKSDYQCDHDLTSLKAAAVHDEEEEGCIYSRRCVLPLFV
jgi:hypothetical protein